MIVIGLTGSIGMGKSTVAGMFETLGVPCHDSDAAAHELMIPGSDAYFEITAAFSPIEFPEIYEGKEKKINRKNLGKLVFSEGKKREALEYILHPYVQKAQQNFIRVQGALGRDMVCLDIPLLFETGAEVRVDYTVVCSASFDVQKARVMERAGMNEEKFHAIIEAQMPDGEKCARADFVVKTGLGRAESMKQVRKIVQNLRTERGAKTHA